MLAASLLAAATSAVAHAQPFGGPAKRADALGFGCGSLGLGVYFGYGDECISLAYSFGSLWSHIGVNFSYRSDPPSEEITDRVSGTLSAELGAVHHLWDQDWNWDPEAGFYGNLSGGIIHRNVLAIGGFGHDRPAVRPVLEGEPKPQPIAGYATTGNLRSDFGFSLGEQETSRAFFSGSLQGSLSYLVLDSSAPAKSAGKYAKELELTLTSSKQLPPNEIAGLNASLRAGVGFDVLPNDEDDVTFINRVRIGVVVDHYVLEDTSVVFTAREELALGFVPMVREFPISWFEIHGRFAVANELTDSAGAMFLPSLTGIGLSQYSGALSFGTAGAAMNTVRVGTGTNLNVIVTGAEVGTSFARFVFEYGRAWGFGTDTSRVGLAGVLSVPNGVFVGLIRRMPVMAGILGGTSGLYLGGTLEDGFASRLQMGGSL